MNRWRRKNPKIYYHNILWCPSCFGVTSPTVYTWYWQSHLARFVLGCVISNWLLVWHTLLNLYFHYIDTALQQIWVKVTGKKQQNDRSRLDGIYHHNDQNYVSLCPLPYWWHPIWTAPMPNKLMLSFLLPFPRTFLTVNLFRPVQDRSAAAFLQLW